MLKIVGAPRKKGSPAFQVRIRASIQWSISSLKLMLAVRKYVEGMKDTSVLLDLLSATGAGDLEPTRTVGARAPLYPDVCFIINILTCD